MKAFYRRLRRALRQWWACRTRRCDYYQQYLVYGPADMPHASFHFESQRADRHFEQCTYNEHPRFRDGWTPDGKLDLCPVCIGFERRLRA